MFMLTVVDRAGVEQFVYAGEHRDSILAHRDRLRREADRLSKHYRVCDEEGREIDWDDESC
jgi:hypothetical protein